MRDKRDSNQKTETDKRKKEKWRENRQKQGEREEN